MDPCRSADPRSRYTGICSSPAKSHSNNQCYNWTANQDKHSTTTFCTVQLFSPGLVLSADCNIVDASSLVSLSFFLGVKEIHISMVQGDPPPEIFLYPDHTQILSLPKALDSGISYQHPFELSQTSRHSKKPQLSSLPIISIISTSTNQHYTSHIHKHLHNISAWLHILSYHLT